MTNLRFLSATAVLLIQVSFAALGQGGGPRILNTTADLESDPQTLLIEGRRFGPEPEVILDGNPLDLLGYIPEIEILALLFPIAPGKYLLRVTDPVTGQFDEVEINLGAGGIQKLTISGAELNVAASALRISGSNLGDGSTLLEEFDVRLFSPDPGGTLPGKNVPLNVVTFNPALQELDADLPPSLFPGTFVLTVTRGNETDTLDVTIDPDMDLEPENEAQTLTRTGSAVSLSSVEGTGGGTVSIDDADADPVNELQTLTRVDSDANLLNPDGTLNGVISINDADASPSNELNQSLALIGTTLAVSDAGGTLLADLGSLTGDSDWTDDGTNVFRMSGNVGIGTATPTATLNVVGSTSLNGGLRVRDIGGNSHWHFGTSHPSTLTGGLFGTNDMQIQSGSDLVLQPNGLVPVGIGVSGAAMCAQTPGCRFHVRGTSRLDGAVTIRDAGGNFHWNFGTSHPSTLSGGLFGTNDMRIQAGSSLILQPNGLPVRTGGPLLVGEGLTAEGALALTNAQVPTASIADGVQLYAEDIAGSSELKVRDEAGNITTLSPHNFSLIGTPSEPLAWSFYSENTSGKINVDMLRALRVLETLSGETLVHIQNEDGSPPHDRNSPSTSVTAQIEKLRDENRQLKAELARIKAVLEMEQRGRGFSEPDQK